jgi:hypothetical protein
MINVRSWTQLRCHQEKHCFSHMRIEHPGQDKPATIIQAVLENADIAESTENAEK